MWVLLILIFAKKTCHLFHLESEYIHGTDIGRDLNGVVEK